MKHTNSKPYGLILAGGYSKRMGQDKALLTFHQKPQLEHIHDMLLPFCDNVFVSTRPDQAELTPYKKFPQLHDLDEFSQAGPLGGIISAMKSYPGASWIVMACDLPFVTSETIHYLIERRKSELSATAYISATDQLPEPLCAIWEGHFLPDILALLKEGVKCPRKILIKSNIQLLTQQHQNWLINVNDPQEYKQFKYSISY